MTSIRKDSDGLRRWLPTQDTLKYGLELLGPKLRTSSIAGLIQALDKRLLAAASFLTIPLAATSWDDIQDAMDAAASTNAGIRICLATRYPALQQHPQGVRPPADVGLMLDIDDLSVPLSAFVDDLIEAVRVDIEVAKMVRLDIRNAILLDSLTKFARNAGMATLGPSLQEDDAFGLPIRFDYVAQDSLGDVLSKHRLKRQP